MEWVETTGRSVQDAKESALDELGVDEAEAEFEVLAEAQTGLFGRLRSEARVRARVRPTAPRAKEDRRGRDRRRRGAGNSAPGEVTSVGVPTAEAGVEEDRSPHSPEPDSGGAPDGAEVDGRQTEGGPDGGGSPRPARKRNRKRKPNGRSDGDSTGDGGPADGGRADGTEAPASDQPARRGGAAGSGGASDRGGAAGAGAGGRSGGGGGGRSTELPWLDDDDYDRKGKGPEVEVDMDRQGEVAADFLTKLTAEMGLDAHVAVTRPDEETVEVQLSGSDLGMLIGPKGATLVAVQNLTRTVVFNETGGHNGHINVDVGGYRQKRTEALARFAAEVAERVKSSGNRTALEPMSAVDRKVVHDTITTIEGVHTTSEGEEPRRRVVVLPD